MYRAADIKYLALSSIGPVSFSIRLSLIILFNISRSRLQQIFLQRSAVLNLHRYIHAALPQQAEKFFVKGQGNTQLP